MENSGYLPEEGVLTYPAVFNRQKQALQDAGERRHRNRGIKFHLAISEPEAIAVYYVWKQLEEDNLEGDMDEQIIGVFDCGGGTTIFPSYVTLEMMMKLEWRFSVPMATIGWEGTC